jgi:hypothetical protein
MQMFLLGLIVGGIACASIMSWLTKKQAVMSYKPKPRYKDTERGVTCELMCLASRHDSPMVQDAILWMEYTGKIVDPRAESWPSELLDSRFERIPN